MSRTTIFPQIPKNSITCLALVRPGSRLAREWQLEKPTYGIYEYSAAFDERVIRFGDGSWQKLSPVDHTDLVLIEAFGEDELDKLFNE